MVFVQLRDHVQKGMTYIYSIIHILILFCRLIQETIQGVRCQENREERHEVYDDGRGLAYHDPQVRPLLGRPQLIRHFEFHQPLTSLVSQ